MGAVERAPAPPRMKILIISYFFPPYNVIGAVRLGKTAKYLLRMGHDVRVLAAAEIPEPPTLALEIPASRVVYTPWFDVDRPYKFALGLWHNVRSRHGARDRAGRSGDLAASGRANVRGTDESPRRKRRGIGELLRMAYTDLFHWPDAALGWRRYATRAGRTMVKDWRPDVMLASGTPWTSFLIARDLARETGVPWVADLRDPWAGNPDSAESGPRKRLVDRYERRVLDSAAYLVTVTEPLARTLRARYPAKSVGVVLNGFDPEDYRQEQTMTAEHAAGRLDASGVRRPAVSGDGVLRVVYTGSMYRGDMTPLLEAVAMLGEEAQSLRLEIIGSSEQKVRDAYCATAARLGSAEQLVWLPAVPHAEAVNTQRNADVLFVLVQDTPYDAGIYTGKLMEYLGAGRPILIVGTSSGVAADLVRGRGLGAAERSPEHIAAQLRAWITEKHDKGTVSTSARAAVDDFSRENQTRRFAEILRTAAAGR